MGSYSPTNIPSEPPQRRHVVLFPFMSKGHTIPLLLLSRLLLSRGLNVTVFTTPANRPFTDQFLYGTTAASVVDIPFPQNIHPEIPAGVESTDKLSSVDERLFYPFALATRHMQADFEKALGSLPRVSFMVSDSFLWWTLDSSTKFGFPRLAFYGFNNYAGSVTRFVAQNGLLHGPESDNELITLTRFPWIKITKEDFGSSFRNHSPEGSEFLMNVVGAVVNSFAVVTNSFYELEPVFVDCWNTESSPKSWNVGPLCQLKPKSGLQNDKPVWIEWLDKKKVEGSRVLYVAFGTQAVISSEQLQEIANALEKSDVNFLWVIRKKESYTWWDSEFEERVRGRGMVVSEWVDQTEILNHESVEGFLSHCGWNSAMEAICAGVPILAWPMMAEQPLNARMVVEEIKVGLRVETCDGSVRGFVKAERLEKMVKKLMEGEEGQVVRKKVKEVGEVARKAVEEGGSSWGTLGLLIDESFGKSLVDSMSQVGRRRGGFRMEDRDINNDMAEIKRMLQQLTVHIDRIKARRRSRKSSDRERDVTTYHQRVDRIETFYQDGDDSDGEICVGPIHNCVPLFESNEEGHSTFNYSGYSEVCDGGVEDQRKNEFVPRNCDDEDDNKAAIKSILWKDIEQKFVDFVGVNAFIMHIPKELVNLVTQIKNGEKIFGIAKLMSERKFMGSRLIIYSKYLFVWKGRIQLQVKGSTKDLKQWKTLSRFLQSMTRI